MNKALILLIKLLGFFIFIDSTTLSYISSPSIIPSYQVIQFLSGLVALYALRQFMINFMWKPRLAIQFIMENYYS